MDALISLLQGFRHADHGTELFVRPALSIRTTTIRCISSGFCAPRNIFDFEVMSVKKNRASFSPFKHKMFLWLEGTFFSRPVIPTGPNHQPQTKTHRKRDVSTDTHARAHTRECTQNTCRRLCGDTWMRGCFNSTSVNDGSTLFFCYVQWEVHWSQKNSHFLLNSI